MPPAKIPGEMAPKGKLRPVIAELAKASGSYIIVSSAGSTADSALKNRRNAMVGAMKGTRNGKKLKVDFYDRNRVATWVRGHAGMIPWVRARIGKAIPGWTPFGAWSYRPDTDDGSYLLDDGARIRTGAEDEGDGLSALQGIEKMREVLRSPGHVIRLVGLSGVGKTKLVEALFDSSVSTDSLDPALAVYADTGTDGLDPQPALLACDLIAHGTRAILVIDNCQAAVHRQLSDIARSAGTTLSVITVEYDIREDQPEGTNVFTLDTSSPELIERLIKRRFPHLSQIDRLTLAEASGGNARVALALAGTVKRNETVAGLGDAVLFDRLFHQRNAPDTGLLSIAQACALVYSFDGETLDGNQAEMPVLAALAGRSVGEVFAAAAELKSRHLLQTRGPWRAVLPHAIANRLAAAALERIPRATVVASFVENGPQRLLRSFSRRLGYLDTSPAARAIVETWLAPGGLLANVFELDEDRQAMFGNVAPAAPAAVLSAFEAAVASAGDARPEAPRRYTRLLRSLAYQSEHFARAVALLVAFSRVPPDRAGENEAAEVVASLFSIVLSGTHAPVDMRIKVMANLLHSDDAAEQGLGINALRVMLKTDHFSSGYSFEFGVRSRDYGYHPRAGEDVAAWFSAVVAFAAPLALTDTDLGCRVRGAIAGEFRGLWANAGLVSELEQLARGIAVKGFWREGWIAARAARTYAGKTLSTDSAARLAALEEFLRPKDLVDKVRGVVLGEMGGRSVDLGDPVEATDGNDVMAAMNRAAATVEALGRDVANDGDAFRTLLPELFAGQHQIVGFGRGLALGADNPAVIWQAMVAAFAATADGSVNLLAGFLDGMQRRDAVLTDSWLDAAVADPILARVFPRLQPDDLVDAAALARLHRALSLRHAPIHAYAHLGWGGRSDHMPAAELKRLLLAINSEPGGTAVAVESLSMRIHGDSAKKAPLAPEIAETGRVLLGAYRFGSKAQRGPMESHGLGLVARASLAGDSGRAVVRQVCQNLVASATSYATAASEYYDLVEAMLRHHPDEVLDAMLAAKLSAKGPRRQRVLSLLRHDRNPMGVVPDEGLLAWCEIDPGPRYPFAASIAVIFHQENEEQPRSWKDIARALLAGAPDKKAVFREFVERIFPTGGVGSLSFQYDARLKLLAELDLTGFSMLNGALKAAKEDLQRHGDAWRRSETEQDRARSGRFED